MQILIDKLKELLKRENKRTELIFEIEDIINELAETNSDPIMTDVIEFMIDTAYYVENEEHRKEDNSYYGNQELNRLTNELINKLEKNIIT